MIHIPSPTLTLLSPFPYLSHSKTGFILLGKLPPASGTVLGPSLSTEITCDPISKKRQANLRLIGLIGRASDEPWTLRSPWQVHTPCEIWGRKAS